MRIEYAQLAIRFFAEEEAIDGPLEIELSNKIQEIQEKLENWIEAEVKDHEFTARVVSW